MAKEKVVEETKNEIPMSPLLVMLIQQIQGESQEKTAKAISLAAQELKLPEGTKADLNRGVWITPPIAPG